ncbi:hypothetical protein BED35_21965 [Yersinia enterocolitica]|uniref:hypothetical protein n=1 Tax=Yersinia TaxID=629 RepID=UPI000327EBA8|nr:MULTISPECIES: hypothetical protein [Yersinia]CNL44228.1 Uncharacterised protein [Yersinia frederiksenii]AOF13174.1 hypothetical protein BB936_00455 [Yersinia enterocolitica]AOF20795.1 hypothetical protein BED34_21500 [Yersinia enterocolitica]AOF21761.1 hypothetical protein BED33_02645 [Yersinia enterocolitica]AOF28970.1 hypothetical protein BED32_21105 [Yersinia enterocolitica]
MKHDTKENSVNHEHVEQVKPHVDVTVGDAVTINDPAIQCECYGEGPLAEKMIGSASILNETLSPTTK